MKQLTTIALVALLTMGLVGVPTFEPDSYDIGFSYHDADARSGRGSFSRGGRSFSGGRNSSIRSTNRGFSVFGGSKSKSSKTKTGKVSTSKGSSRKGTHKVKSKKPKHVKFAALPKKHQNMQGKASLNKVRGKFKKPAVSPVSKGTKPSQQRSEYREKYVGDPYYNRSRGYDSSTYYGRRNRMYNGWDNNPPSYVYNSPSSFGMMDAMILYWIMDNSSNAGTFAHNNQNNPDWLAAKADMEKNAENNAELAAKLASMEAEMAKLSGTPIDTSYLPPGVDADMILSQEALSSTRPDFRLCVNSQTGTYFKIAGLMSLAASRVNIVPVSEPTLANIESGKCDGGFVQADAYWNYVEENRLSNMSGFEVVMQPYREKVHLVCDGDSVDELSDLDSSDHKVWFPNGSGAAETWKNLVAENDDYEPVKTVLNSDTKIATYEGAMLMARNDPDACFMYVGADKASTFMRNVEASAKANNIRLISVRDGDVDETKDPSGRLVYNNDMIDESRYPNLLGGVGWFDDSQYTLSVGADLIVSAAWKEKHPKLYPMMASDMLGLQPEIDRLVK